MANFAKEMNVLLGHAFGKRETVNFNALHSLLGAIILQVANISSVGVTMKDTTDESDREAGVEGPDTSDQSSHGVRKKQMKQFSEPKVGHDISGYEICFSKSQSAPSSLLYLNVEDVKQADKLEVKKTRKTSSSHRVKKDGKKTSSATKTLGVDTPEVSDSGSVKEKPVRKPSISRTRKVSRKYSRPPATERKSSAVSEASSRLSSSSSHESLGSGTSSTKKKAKAHGTQKRERKISARQMDRKPSVNRERKVSVRQTLPRSPSKGSLVDDQNVKSASASKDTNTKRKLTIESEEETGPREGSAKKRDFATQKEKSQNVIQHATENMKDFVSPTMVKSMDTKMVQMPGKAEKEDKKKGNETRGRKEQVEENDEGAEEGELVHKPNETIEQRTTGIEHSDYQNEAITTPPIISVSEEPKEIHATEDSFTQREFSVPSIPVSSSDDQVTRQDLDDIAKRISLLEKDDTRKKTFQKWTSSSSSTDTKDKDIEILEKREKGMQKHIEATEKEMDGKVDDIWKEFKDLRAQLLYLPHPDTLYKSFFPSWKMLEDAICAHPILNQNIADVKESLEASSGTGSGKQLSKFLGVPGPSNRLIETFDILSRLLEQARMGGLELLARNVSDVRMATTSKRIKGEKLPVDSRPFQMAISAVEEHDDLTGSDQASDSTHSSSSNEVAEKPSVSKMNGAGKTDTGYMNFKMAKLLEETVQIRKELDNMQLWKDTLQNIEGDVLQLTDLLLTLRRDLEMKEEKDHEVIGNLQVDLIELHSEICGVDSKKAMQTRKMEMESVKVQQVVQETHPRYMPLGDVVIDREARIRNQQLQMQLNVLHNKLIQLETRLPDMDYNPAPAGMPDSLQNPWGTGRFGYGTSIRSSMGSTPSTPASTVHFVSPKPNYETRPITLGGGSEETEKLAITTDASPFHSTQQEKERQETQFAITRLNQAQTNTATRLEDFQDQQSSELNKLHHLLTRMHREYMTRCIELQEQLTEALGERVDEYDESDHSEETAQQEQGMEEMTATHQATDERNQLSQEADPNSVFLTAPMGGEGEEGRSTDPPGRNRSRGKRQLSALQSKSAVTPNKLYTLRKELMGYIKSISKRIHHLENYVPFLPLPEADAALMKKPFVEQVQCLSCDKRIDVARYRDQVSFLPASVVPELPHLPLLPIPPRVRNIKERESKKSARDFGKNIDVYETARPCGGSYTTYSKSRHIHYYCANLSDVIETPDEPQNIESVEVKGSDGHIYKGQVDAPQNNSSPRNSTRFDCLTPGEPHWM